ncbi:MAG: hypothetical protein ACI9RU_001925 [Litorivivens sp.]|jgi:hypothetical protein
MVEVNPEIQHDQVLMDLSGLAAGTYTLVVRQAEKVWNKGVVIER